MIDLVLQLTFPSVYLTGVRAGAVPQWTLPFAVAAAATMTGHTILAVLSGDLVVAAVKLSAAAVWVEAAYQLWRQRPRRRPERSASRVVNLGHRLATVAAR